MQNFRKRFFHWLPRVLAIAGILFLSMFALDVFVEYATLSEIVVALTMHLVPSFILIAALVIAWRWRIPGGALFIALGIFSIFAFDTYEDPVSFFLISLPPMIVGLLFVWDGLLPPTSDGLEPSSTG